MISGWRYYNHAAVPTTPPHINPNLEPIENGSIWKSLGGGTALLARWVTNWDCGIETNFWYVIKDAPFDISSVKSKRRYEINKGNKHFNTRQINPKEYVEEIYDITNEAYKTYPSSYRPNLNKEEFFKDVETWDDYLVYGAFDLDDENNPLCGYARLKVRDKQIDFMNQKVIPSYERNGINVALVYRILLDNEKQLNAGYYICDGGRNLVHETAFQEYLEKYFGFRKAYCKLNIKYRPHLGWLIKALFPFRKLLYKVHVFPVIRKIMPIFTMEEIVRKDKYLKFE